MKSLEVPRWNDSEWVDLSMPLDPLLPCSWPQLPAFAAAVPGTAVVIVWVVAERYEQLAIRYLFDVERDLRFGG